VLINLATGLEDPERVTVAFLVAGAALQRGATVAIWLTKEAVRLALPGHAQAVACEGCPPLDRLFEQYAEGQGELLVCPMLQRPEVDRECPGSERAAGRRNADVRVDRRRTGDRLQLLNPGRNLAAVRDGRGPQRRINVPEGCCCVST
jgi:predicted peroxiredoxin